MPSALTWLDFTEADRQQVLQVLNLFREKGTLDELGFAPIRDGFADFLFPGTSTIQTRARYFLFVPWIMRRLSRRTLPPPEFARRLRDSEARLIKALLAGDPEQYGIIGREAGETLKRMPSVVYWRGLHLLGIRLIAGSIEQYARRLARGLRTGALVTDDGEPLEITTSDWHPDLPPEPADMLSQASLELTIDEAEFLRDRILATQPTSLLAHAVGRTVEPLDAAYVWDAAGGFALRSDLKDAVEHARRFSLCAWGGSLTYVRMVAALKQKEELVANIDKRLQQWKAELSQDASMRFHWNQAAFWTLVRRMNPRMPQATQEFAKAWISIAFRAADGDSVWEERAVQDLIVDRERGLKKDRARLSNQQARDRWQGNADIGRMDFRWQQACTILNDIVRGSRRNANKKGDFHA